MSDFLADADDVTINAAVAEIPTKLAKAMDGYNFARLRPDAPYVELDRLYNAHETALAHVRNAAPNNMAPATELRAAKIAHIQAATAAYDAFAPLLTMSDDELADALAKIGGRPMPRRLNTAELQTAAAHQAFAVAAANADYAARNAALGLLAQLHERAIIVRLAGEDLHVFGRASEADYDRLRGLKPAVVAALSECTVI